MLCCLQGNKRDWAPLYTTGYQRHRDPLEFELPISPSSDNSPIHHGLVFETTPTIDTSSQKSVEQSTTTTSRSSWSMKNNSAQHRHTASTHPSLSTVAISTQNTLTANSSFNSLTRDSHLGSHLACSRHSSYRPPWWLTYATSTDNIAVESVATTNREPVPSVTASVNTTPQSTVTPSCKSLASPVALNLNISQPTHTSIRETNYMSSTNLRSYLELPTTSDNPSTSTAPETYSCKSPFALNVVSTFELVN